MPTIDKYQNIVVSALQKAGWRVDENPYYIRLDRRAVFVDLSAQRTDEDAHQQIIILEVKGFEGRSPVHDLEEAVGQYVTYRALLEESGVNNPLYLAVPVAAFEGILNESIGQVIRRRLRVKIMVFDIGSEEIIQWLD